MNRPEKSANLDNITILYNFKQGIASNIGRREMFGLQTHPRKSTQLNRTTHHRLLRYLLCLRSLLLLLLLLVVVQLFFCRSQLPLQAGNDLLRSELLITQSLLIFDPLGPDGELNGRNCLRDVVSVEGASSNDAGPASTTKRVLEDSGEF